MLNPALLGLVVATTANQYETVSGFPMPWTLSFLTCPLALHGPTTEVLPRVSTTSLGNWAQQHPVLIAGFSERARHMATHVREGIRFGLHEGFLELVDAEALRCAELPKTSPKTGGDLHQIVLGAGMIGRVFGKSLSPATIFATLRVRP